MFSSRSLHTVALGGRLVWCPYVTSTGTVTEDSHLVIENVPSTNESERKCINDRACATTAAATGGTHHVPKDWFTRNG